MMSLLGLIAAGCAAAIKVEYRKTHGVKKFDRPAG